mmetsp:Transcript_53111/g.121274  ORF Transcript_53111/g.121274 Transcript_53111/m.121274 type:complete len:218 (-) Transcript_53111:976-1629(-)
MKSCHHLRAFQFRPSPFGLLLPRHLLPLLYRTPWDLQLLVWVVGGMMLMRMSGSPGRGTSRIAGVRPVPLWPLTLLRCPTPTRCGSQMGQRWGLSSSISGGIPLHRLPSLTATLATSRVVAAPGRQKTAPASSMRSTLVGPRRGRLGKSSGSSTPGWAPPRTPPVLLRPVPTVTLATSRVGAALALRERRLIASMPSTPLPRQPRGRRSSASLTQDW